MAPMGTFAGITARAHCTLLVPLTLMLPRHLMAIAFATSKREYVKKNKSMGLTAKILHCPGDGRAASCSQRLLTRCLVSFPFLYWYSGIKPGGSSKTISHGFCFGLLLVYSLMFSENGNHRQKSGP